MIPLRDNLSCKSFPLATIFLIVLNCLGFAVELAYASQGLLQDFVMKYALVPAKVTAAFASGDPALIGGAILTVITAMFLHGGWMHLIGNMVFLQAFGRAVENRLGPTRYVAVYLLTGAAAWYFHYLTDSMSWIPALGASGAIAGVLGAYLVFYPKADFRTLFLVGPFPVLATIRAYWLLPVWFASQLLPGLLALAETVSGPGVAYWAHIGGFAAGLACAGLWAVVRPLSDVCYVPMTCDCSHDCGKKDFSIKKLFGAPEQKKHGGPCKGEDKDCGS